MLDDDEEELLEEEEEEDEDAGEVFEMGDVDKSLEDSFEYFAR